MRGARGLLVAALLCLVGGSAVLASVGRPWVRLDLRVETATATRPDAFVATSVTRSGDEVAGGVRALGLVSLAGAVALISTRGRGRRAVGIALLLAGAGTAGLALRVRADPEGALVRGGAAPVSSGDVRDRGVTGPAVGGAAAAAVLGGLLVAASGGLAVSVSQGWPGMSARYDGPTDRPRRDELTEIWDAVERGEEPRP